MQYKERGAQMKKHKDKNNPPALQGDIDEFIFMEEEYRVSER